MERDSCVCMWYQNSYQKDPFHAGHSYMKPNTVYIGFHDQTPSRGSGSLNPKVYYGTVLYHIGTNIT